MKWLSTVTVDADGIRIGSQTWEWPAVDVVSNADFLVVGRLTLRLVDGTRVSAWGSAFRREGHRAFSGRRACLCGRQPRESASSRRIGISRPSWTVTDTCRSRLSAGSRQRTPRCLTSYASLISWRGVATPRPRGSPSSRPICRPPSSSRNRAWSVAEQERWRHLFDVLESTPLTPEQRKAVVDFENRNLLVAAAGSGKSSTLVAKIAYAVRKGLARPEEILALAFNKKAAMELRERIASRLADIDGSASICSETFHGLGYRILAEDRRPTVETGREKLIADVYEHLRSTDGEFRRDVVHFVLNFTPDLVDPAKFSSYEEYLLYLRDQEGPGRRGRRVATLSGHQVASLQEMKIANWLFTHGVQFEYEKSYPHTEATKDRRGYTPDFYYPDIDVWHEHFGVDAAGRPPSWFQDADEYVAGMKWKRECHAAFGTRLVETTSAMFSDGSIFATLERVLREHGQPLRELSASEVDALLGKGSHRDFATLLTTFIAHWKSRRIPFDELMERGSARDRAFLPICRRVYEEYSRHLDSERRFDFDDLILRATDRVRNGEWRSPFKLILVDEFQDISVARSEFLKALLAQHDDAVLFCVGDDWQAINGFAGSELAIMRNFEREFGPSAVNYLTQTFRSNQGLSDAARKFIERNPAQLRKKVHSHDGTVEDCIRIIRCSGDDDYTATYEAIAEELAGGGKVKVRILGRYRKQQSRIALDVFARAGRDIDAEFDTVHGSKGLQADYVILDRVEGRGSFTFPSTIQNDSVLHLVMPEREPFPNAEERRLMYVGLTRAKRRVYILTRRGRESAFVTELEEAQRLQATAPDTQAEPLYACPYCKSGVRVRRNGKYGQFWGCSRFPDCSGKPPVAIERSGEMKLGSG